MAHGRETLVFEDPFVEVMQMDGAALPYDDYREPAAASVPEIG